MDINKPIRLCEATAWRSYLGGSMIDEIHGRTGEDDHFPEEWILSTVVARNVGREDIVEGLSETPDGVSLKSIIENDPEGTLGKAHFEKYGATPGVLLKLLDSAQRLLVQVHPTKDAAKKLFNSAFGKTECWHIVKCRELDGETPCVYLGFKEGVTREHWIDCFNKQDIPEMLNCLHRFDVAPGETYLICGGVPHAIGKGCFLVEIQEPTDYTIRTERKNPNGTIAPDAACHQGIGFEKMFDCFNYQGYSFEETAKKWRIEPQTENFDGYTVSEVIGYRDTPMFKLEVIDIEKNRECKIASNGVFSGLYILYGNGTVGGEAVVGGDQFFLSAECETFKVTAGNEPVRALRFYGPKL